MAYVPGFQYDLFISYASTDGDCRLAQFVVDLRKYFSEAFGKLFPNESVFFDRQDLNRSPTQWKEKLKESAGSAAILVPILSPGYATSEYCAKEWEWFCEGHSLSWPVGKEEPVYRVCPVAWHPLDDEMRGQIASEILNAQEQQSPSVEELGSKIANGLRLMRRSRQTVFVGECEHDVRQRIRDEMSRMGFRVMPEAPTAYGDEHIVRQHLGVARLAVHFVGGQTEQHALDAIRWSHQDCQGATVVYEVPGHDLTPEERISLEWIEEDLRQASVDDPRAYDRVSRKNLDQFLQILRGRLEDVRPVAPTHLGVACEETDRSAAEGIIPEIQARTGFSVTCHGMSLLDFKKSRGVLFYWGKAEGKWLRRARVVTQGLCEAFFLAPPHNSPEYEQELGALAYRQHGDRFQLDDIRPFLRVLGWVG